MEYTQLNVIDENGNHIATANVVCGHELPEALEKVISMHGSKKVVTALSMIRDWYAIDAGSRQNHPSTRRSGTFQGRKFLAGFGVVARPFEIQGKPTRYCELNLSTLTVSSTI